MSLQDFYRSLSERIDSMKDDGDPRHWYEIEIEILRARIDSQDAYIKTMSEDFKKLEKKKNFEAMDIIDAITSALKKEDEKIKEQADVFTIAFKYLCSKELDKMNARFKKDAEELQKGREL